MSKAEYRDTLFLPRTDFPMRAGLPQREPEILARWARLGMYRRLRAAAAGREKFILHDGPPYANGNIHIGHALNKILKDIINRAQQMMGRDANYVPGWDCHGLPIEWKIEESYRAAGRNKDEVPLVEFRRECRDFAAHWIEVQREEFRRLGVEGDWENPYTTMAFAAEAQIVREFLHLLMNGDIYRGSKPVMWSVVERTALAEAEIEYHDHVSPEVYVRFPILRAPDPRLEGAGVVIWTTTPWTIPGNRAIAYNPDLTYVLLRAREVGEGGAAVAGGRYVVAKPLLESFAQAARISGHDIEAEFAGAALAGTVCAHPLRGRGYDFEVPLHPADFVTEDQGTGFVHVAPGHGAEDYELGLRHHIAVPETVTADGRYHDHVPLFAGRSVIREDGSEGDANRAVMEALREVGALLASGRLTHQYPHSWRSKAPLIFRNTPQWFVSMDMNGLRQVALAAIDATRWVPPAGRNRIHAMVENRPDWVLSRQRAWGVPLTAFVAKDSGAVLRDPRVNARILAAIESEGADAWFTSDAARFLAPDHDPAAYDKAEDILDVWFDSGSSHAFVLEARADLRWPADLYLEGSDQHRGWFHSSLLESCATRGRAPYRAVLTHGFVLDEKGRKMSKSLGNVVAPQEVVEQNGAEILRLWVASSDFSKDLLLGPDILRANVDSYRKLRNTLRFLLGNLDGFSAAERLEAAEMPELERFMLHRLAVLDAAIRHGYDAFDLPRVFGLLFNFCTVELSAFYFDIRKDALYCDGADSPRRRAARTVLDHLFSCLTAWLAPILAFTAEEAWLSRFPGESESVHLRLFPDLPAAWRDDELAARWEILRQVRRVITGALEVERREKRIGASLEAAPVLHVTDAAWRRALEGLDLAEIAITSGLRLDAGPIPAGAFSLPDLPGVAVSPALAEGAKCERCWLILPEVEGNGELCHRCQAVLRDRALAAVASSGR